MDPLYDVCFAGEILQGQDLDTVKLKIAKLFNANDATLDKLFSGKTQLLKRGCDRETALKYKKAIEQAGARPVVRNSAQDTAEESPRATPEPPAPAETAPKLTAAERIARLAAAPDVSSSASEAPEVMASAAADSKADKDSNGFDLAPAGADVLRPEERQPEVRSNVQTSDIELMSVGADLSDITQEEISAPDVSHLSMGEVGEDIPNLIQTRELVSPDTSAISLSPEDSDFSDCAPAPVAELEVDLSAIELAPSGTDMLESQYRKSNDEAPPKTDHLSLED